MHLGKVKKQLRIRANVSLTTVIIAGAILITTGLTVLENAIDVSLTSRSYQERIVADIATTSCIEEAMFKIARVNSFEGEVSISTEEYSCNATVTTDAVDSNIKIIVIDTTYGDYSVSITKYADTSVSPYNLYN